MWQIDTYVEDEVNQAYRNIAGGNVYQPEWVLSM
jgi:hypothetical protein